MPSAIKKPSMKKPAATLKPFKKPAAAAALKKPATIGAGEEPAGPESMMEAVEEGAPAFPLELQVVEVPEECEDEMPIVDWECSPSQQARDEAPPGWLMEWDFMTRRQQLYIPHNPEGGVFRAGVESQDSQDSQ